MLLAERDVKQLLFSKFRVCRAGVGGIPCLRQSRWSGGCLDHPTLDWRAGLPGLQVVPIASPAPAAARVASSRGSSSSLVHKLIAGQSEALARFKLGCTAPCWLCAPGGVGSSTCRVLPGGTGWLCSPRLCGQVLATVLGHSDLCVPSGRHRCIGNSSGHQRHRAFSDLGKHERKSRRRSGMERVAGAGIALGSAVCSRSHLSSWEIPEETRTPRMKVRCGVEQGSQIPQSQWDVGGRRGEWDMPRQRL